LLEECQKPIILQKLINKKEFFGLKNWKNGMLKIFKEFFLLMKVMYVAQNKAFSGLENKKIKIGLMIWFNI